MFLNLQKVGVFIDDKHRDEPVDQLQKELESHHIETIFLNWESAERNDFDLIIAMGGDGTVLYVLNQFEGVPVLAINYGNVGFLTAGNREDLPMIIERLLSHDFFVSERFIMECHVGGKISHAINEVVIKGISRLVVVDCFVNDTRVRQIRGDGLIVGTPTGSTAYLLSAGAPIVMPEARCMILAGLNEYNFSSRHLVLNHDAHIRLAITPQTKESDIYLTVDGQERIPISINDELTICQSKRRATLIFLDQHYFFHNLSSRLSWGPEN